MAATSKKPAAKKPAAAKKPVATEEPDEAETPDEAHEAEEMLVLDARSFNSAERLECQVRFDASFGDLLRNIFEAVDVRREGLMETRIVDREGTQFFPDQIILFMLWVQAKRTNPDAVLEDFDSLPIGDLTLAHIRGLVGKANGSAKSKKPSRGRGSAGSSTA